MKTDLIYLVKDEEGDHFFEGEITVDNVDYFVNGITINTAFAETIYEGHGIDMIDYNTEIQIDEIFSGVDWCEEHDEVDGLLEALVQL